MSLPGASRASAVSALRGERPSSVSVVVRRVRDGLRAARALECLLLGAAAVLLAQAAARASGVSGTEAWKPALVCGVLSAATWWREHPARLRDTAAALDRRLAHGGSLITALEIEARIARGGAENGLEELVRERVLARLRTRPALRELWPSPFVPAAAPALAALVFLLVADAEGRPGARGNDALGRTTAGLEQSLAALEQALGAIESGTAAVDPSSGATAPARDLPAVSSALHAAREALRASDEGRRDPSRARERLHELAHELDELAVHAPPAAELAARLGEARAWLQALDAALASLAGGPAAAGDLTAGAPDGTISGSAPTGRSSLGDPQSNPISAPAPAPPADGSGSFWPSDSDAVVERWIELSRAAHDPEPSRKP